MRIAIVGSREGLPWKRVGDLIRALVRRPEVKVVVSGGAMGVDRMAEIEAARAGKEVVVIRPDWKTHGKAAGYLRNVQIVEQADEVHAFWNGSSRGTMHTIGIAGKLRKPLHVVELRGRTAEPPGAGGGGRVTR